jgi:hypothetical protein
MLEKIKYCHCVEIINGQRRWRFVCSFTGVLKKEPECIFVGSDGMRTRIPLADKPLAKEVLQHK